LELRSTLSMYYEFEYDKTQSGITDVLRLLVAFGLSYTDLLLLQALC